MWTAEGHIAWPHANSLLLLCDGSNSSRKYLFKQDLQDLTNRIGLEIRVAHYPPYTSKYNPIEHWMFPHVSRACQSVIFKTVEQVQYYMAKAKTGTGLSVTVNILKGIYAAGRKVAEGFKNQANRLRQHSPSLQLPGHPDASVKAGSYSSSVT